jgi:1-acyl-sn-glycerol-3-phosphate acyltransferase
VQQTSAPILPVWVDGSDRIMPPGARFPRFWRPMTLVIGEPLYFEKPATFKEENGFITETLSTALLALAEEIP